jgi:hypothetical protein
MFSNLNALKAVKPIGILLFSNETFLDLTNADTDILCKTEIKCKYSGEHLKDENACNSLRGEA